jgi:hypothetical protein
VQEVKTNFSACKQFFNLEIDARIIAAALNLLGLRSLEGIPDESALPAAMKEASLQTRKAILQDLCFQVVDKLDLREDEMNQLISKLEKEKEADVVMLQMVASLADILVAKNHLLVMVRLERITRRHMGSKEII